MQKNGYTCFIYVALPCEAKPLIEHFGLKKNLAIDAFVVYGNNELCLTVTGVGKSAMAAAIGYTQAFFASTAPCILLNVGIAGHKHHPVGQLFLIDKISDVDTGKNYYPPIIFKTEWATSSLQTVSKPVLVYDNVCLCDMEASAFYETASRFSTGELIQCVKIISDNESSLVSAIQPQYVSGLIAEHLTAIARLLTDLTPLVQAVTPCEPELLAQWLGCHYFTASEQRQLKTQLSRWQVLTDNKPLAVSDIFAQNAKDLLRGLEQKVAEVAFCL